jgi:hypothetical protein
MNMEKKIMGKYTKLFSAFILSAVLALEFISCNDDGYSLDKYWRSMATVNKTGDNTYDFTLDNGKKLWIAAPAGLNLNPKYDRAIIDYTILSDAQNGYDHFIKLNRFYDVLTKDAIYIAPGDQVKQDSIGHDPIKVHSVWEGGDYLNIYFGFNAGGVNSHMINLVSAEPDLSVNEDIVKVEFRHNKKDDPEHYPSNGYVSFDLSPYKTGGRNKVTFELTWEDFNGETKTYRIEYKYDKTDDRSGNEALNENYNTNLNIY